MPSGDIARQQGTTTVPRKPATFAARARALAGRTPVVAQAETAVTRILAAAEAPTLRRPAPASEPPPPPVTTLPVHAARAPLFLVLGVVAVVLGAGATGAYLLLRRPPPSLLADQAPSTVVDVPSEPLGTSPAARDEAAAPAESISGAPVGQVVVVPVPAVAPPAATAPPPAPQLAAIASAPPPGAGSVPAPAASSPAPAAGAAMSPLDSPQTVPTPAATAPSGALEAGQPPEPIAPIEVAETYESRGAVEFDLDPENTEIWIGGERIGTSEGLDGEPYALPGPGTYDLRLTREGFETIWIRIRVHPEAEDEIAEVDTELRRVRRRRGVRP